jgi:chemotaxis protein histidine kinase CheA
MDSTPHPTQADARQDTVVKTLEEALSRLGQEGTASASDRRTEMTSSDPQQPLEEMALADLRQTVNRLAVGQQQIKRDIASLQATKPSLHTTLPPADLKRMIGLLSDTPPPGRRASRAFTRFLIVGFIGVGGILAWQFYDEAAKQTLASWASQLGWELSLPGRKPPPGAGLKIAERPSSRALQESAPDLPETASAPQTAPDIGAPTPPTSPSREVQQPLEVMARDLADLRQTIDQLEVMARDLADLRQTVNQLVVRQEQMARDIATLQAAEKDLRPRISAPKPAAAPARSPAPKPPPQATPQISAVSPPPPKPPPQATPQILAVPPPPRPSSVESASPPPVRTEFPIQDAADDAWREWSRSRARPSETPKNSLSSDQP